MPLTGNYEPGAMSFARDQVDRYERSGGTDGTQQGGKPVIILTSVGAKTGKLRKAPLMRVEHDGQYAVVASLGGAPEHPVWYYNLTANPHVELQDGPVKKDYQAREVHGAERETWWERRRRRLAGLRRVPEEDDKDHPRVRPHPGEHLTGAFGGPGRTCGARPAGSRALSHISWR